MSYLEVNNSIKIPLREFSFSYARSGGPGGQNVNKVNSKVIMHWDFANSPSVPAPVKARFKEKWANRITDEGVVVLHGDRYRDQERNRGEVQLRLAEMIRTVAKPPKKRKPTKPSKAAKERRLSGKKEQSEKKRRRQRVDY